MCSMTLMRENEFHGGTVGMVGEIRHGSWTLSGLAKFSVGNMHQSVRDQRLPEHYGTHRCCRPCDPGGLLAQPTNMGDLRS